MHLVWLYVVAVIVIVVVVNGQNPEEVAVNRHTRGKKNVDECLSNPCQNGGTCTDQINGYQCQCAPGYVGLQCQTAWLESPCTANSECPVAASECFKGKCLCTPGYYYSTGSRTCLTDCPKEDLGKAFVRYEESDMDSSHIWGGVVNVTECLDRCQHKVNNCRSITYAVVWPYCQLFARTALTLLPAPSKNYYDRDDNYYDHYQRTCA